ncbi:MAG: ThuA domain-containing protein [Rhodothermales bacterium]|nr:ThuA domain-containing protein [Rhodothermales bacterium]MBO6780809.1 ThuA domain-containing protein [Rhodothermales bacterium]
MRFLLITALLAGCAAAPDNPHLVQYEGSEGPGVGKHIVFLAGDHEYRSEEILPAWARIMARHYGFETSVFFTLDEEGFIEPGSSRIAGLDVLGDADLLVLGLRFQDFPEAEMQHIVDYLDRSGPVIGIRTSTHAFAIEDGPHAHYAWNYQGDDYHLGFGRQVLGETWAGHYGTNHEQASRLLVQEIEHPILRGVTGGHVVSGGYEALPEPPFTVLVRGEVLNGMTADAPPDTTKELMPVAWTRTHGDDARVFTTTHGASEDFLDPGFRRLLVNATLWAAGLEGEIHADGPIEFVGPYHPVEFAFDGYRLGVRPSELRGWDSPILPPDRPTEQ